MEKTFSAQTSSARVERITELSKDGATGDGREPERFETIVIGGGQSGLAAGYYLKKRNMPFVILDASERIGDSWRTRWDSLHLFTPAKFSSIPGMPFPAPPNSFPPKDAMADYLEQYAEHFDLPVRSGVRVTRLSRNENGLLLEAGDQRYEADNVIVAMSNFQRPKVPAFAQDLNPDIVQLHSSEYRNPSQLKPGGVLVVGAGNSGAEIGMDVVKHHPTWISGRDPGQIPFDITGFMARLILVRLVLRVLFYRVLTINTPIGRKARPIVLSRGGPLIRTKRKHLSKAGAELVPRVAGVENGLPVLEDGRTLEVANVIWTTGYHPGFSWIDLPIHGDLEPRHERGVVASEPGLYFLGLEFLYAPASVMIQGVGRDAEYIVNHIATERAQKTAEGRNLTSTAA